MPASQVEQVDRVLTPTAVAFVEELTRRFRPRIEELLERRRSVQQRYDNGERPDFLAETADIRNREWTVAPIPADLHDRRVEIASGPTSSPTPRSWSNRRRARAPAPACATTSGSASSISKRGWAARARCRSTT